MRTLDGKSDVSCRVLRGVRLTLIATEAMQLDYLMAARRLQSKTQTGDPRRRTDEISSVVEQVASLHQWWMPVCLPLQLQCQTKWCVSKTISGINRNIPLLSIFSLLHRSGSSASLWECLQHPNIQQHQSSHEKQGDSSYRRFLFCPKLKLALQESHMDFQESYRVGLQEKADEKRLVNA